jgi:hypothetical protein
MEVQGAGIVARPVLYLSVKTSIRMLRDATNAKQIFTATVLMLNAHSNLTLQLLGVKLGE